MEMFSTVELILWLGLLAAQLLVCFVAWRRNLSRRFLLFLSYLLFETLSGIAQFSVRNNPQTLLALYNWCAMISAVLRIGVVAEVVYLVFHEFNGRGVAFRNAFSMATAAIGGVLAFCSLVPLRGIQWAWHDAPVLIVHEWQTCAFVVVLAGSWLVLRYAMPVTAYLSPLVLLHWRLVTVFFVTGGVASLVAMLGGGGPLIHQVNIVMLAVDLGCCGAWIFGLKEAVAPAKLWPRLTPEQIVSIRKQEEELLAVATRLGGGAGR